MKLWRALFGKARAPLDIAVTCPRCRARVEPAREVRIVWEEPQQRFTVQRHAHCVPCRVDFPVVVKAVPLVLTHAARCACGAQLALARHTWRKTGEEVACEATYVCPACARRKQVVVGKLKRALATRWRHTTHIAIGPTGVQYQQITAAGEAPPSVKAATHG